MLWNAITGMLIGIVMPEAPPEVVTPMFTRASTFESGCAVPICEVLEYDNSNFPAAAGVQVNVTLLRVCFACICTVAVAVPPAMSTT